MPKYTVLTVDFEDGEVETTFVKAKTPAHAADKILIKSDGDLEIGMVFKGYVDDLNWNHVSEMRGENA